MRLVGVVALLAALVAPGVAASPTGCDGQQAPPPPAAADEVVGPAVAPVPWPDEPVGGPQMGACDEVGTTGAPHVTAAGWVLADLDTGAVLAARAPHARHRPASTLKVLTALVAIRRLDPDSVVAGTAEDEAIEGSKAGIGAGGQYTVRQLLAGLLLNSGNDTAEALARALGGDAATLAAMTETAHDLGALDTRPATPSGLDGPGMSSSAYDLALLFRAAMREPLFAQTIATRSIDFPGYGEHPGFVLHNSSKLLARYPGAIGGKTGYTNAARHTLVGAAEHNGRRLVVAMVRGEQSSEPMWQQATALFDWGFAMPAGRAPVGELVDAAPVPPAAVAATGGSEAPTTAHSTQVPAEVPIGMGAIALSAMAVGGVAMFRRSRR